MSKVNSPSAKAYVAGFVISVILTLEAYYLVVHEALSYWLLIFTVLALAVVQLFVQVYFFLHLGEETKPRWRLTTFLFAGMVVLIVVLGSFWIMTNLNYNNDDYFSPEQTDQYIQQQEAIKR